MFKWIKDICNNSGDIDFVRQEEIMNKTVKLNPGEKITIEATSETDNKYKKISLDMGRTELILQSDIDEALKRSALETEKQKELSQKLLDEDNLIKLSSVNWIPNIKIIKGLNGNYIEYEDILAPCSYIEKISIMRLGKPPRLIKNSKNSRCYDIGHYLSIISSPEASLYPAMESIIEIQLLSGSKYHLTCNLYYTDVLYNALLKAWRDNV